MLPTGHLLLWILAWIRSKLYFPSVRVTVLGHQPDLALLSHWGPVYKQTALGEGLTAGFYFLPVGNHQNKNACELISVQNSKLLLKFFSFWSIYEAFFKLTLYGRYSEQISCSLLCVLSTADMGQSGVTGGQHGDFPDVLEWRSNINTQFSRGLLEWDLHVLDTLWTLHVAEQKRVIQHRIISSSSIVLKKTIKTFK